MFIKKAIYFADPQTLNVPVFDGSWSYLKSDPSIFSEQNLKDTLWTIKTAAHKSSSINVDGDNTEFDLEAEVREHPNSLYVKCFAIKADETNDNGDYFEKKELKKATPTFVGVPVFTNHNNNDVEEARGKVVHSWWDEDKNGIMIIARIDAEAYPKLARTIKEKITMATSMGAQVQFSICSICHNVASTPTDYCPCIKERKTRKISDKNVKCQYHKNGTEEECPKCGCKKGETKKFAVENISAFEYNYGVKFIENSFVVNPACHDCGVTEVIDTQEFIKKVAYISAKLPALLKAAASHNVMCTDKACIKLAGQKEIDQLNQALDLMTSVAQSMLKQKDQLDLEFLSDLVEVVADLQTVTDELMQQGYGRLQSPPETPGEETTPSTTPTSTPSPAGQNSGIPGLQPMNPTPGGGSKIQTGPAGEAGSVTSPMANRHISISKLGQFLKKRLAKSVDPKCKKIFKFDQKFLKMNKDTEIFAQK
jgi:hypothetical protein